MPYICLNKQTKTNIMYKLNETSVILNINGTEGRSIKELEAAEPRPEAEAEATAEIGAAETPDWLSERIEEPVSTVTVEEMPDWLGQLSSSEEEAVDEPVPVAPGDHVPPRPCHSLRCPQ